MESPYDGWDQPVGCYASELEAEWAAWLQWTGWPHRYVGRGRGGPHFELLPAGLAPLPVEVTPDGERFLEQAVQRRLGSMSWPRHFSDPRPSVAPALLVCSGSQKGGATVSDTHHRP
jgi:hypothetical protein